MQNVKPFSLIKYKKKKIKMSSAEVVITLQKVLFLVAITMNITKSDPTGFYSDFKQPGVRKKFFFLQ